MFSHEHMGISSRFPLETNPLRYIHLEIHYTQVLMGQVTYNVFFFKHTTFDDTGVPQVDTPPVSGKADICGAGKRGSSLVDGRKDQSEGFRSLKMHGVLDQWRLGF